MRWKLFFLILVELSLLSLLSLVEWTFSAGLGTLFLLIHGMSLLVRQNMEWVSSTSEPATSSAADIAFSEFQKNLQNYQRPTSNPTPSIQKTSTAQTPASKTPSTSKKKASSKPASSNPASSKPKASLVEAKKRALQAKKKNTNKNTEFAKLEPSSSIKEPLQLSPELLKKLQQATEGTEDLFADTQIPLAASPVVATLPESDSFMDEGLNRALGGNHSTEEMASEAQSLLGIAQSAYASGRTAEAKASLDNYFHLKQELQETPAWKDIYLYAQVCLKAGDVDVAAEQFQNILTQLQKNDEQQYLNTLQEVSALLENSESAQLALPFLQRLLNHHREKLDRDAMDQVYERIEGTLEQLQDYPRLIQMYKNHLEIKRILKDVDGESELLDRIGKCYYQLGDQEQSRQYYEENLKLRSASSHT